MFGALYRSLRLSMLYRVERIVYTFGASVVPVPKPQSSQHKNDNYKFSGSHGRDEKLSTQID